MTGGAWLLGVVLTAAPPQEDLLQYEVNGLRVVHQVRPSTSSIVAAQLYLLGGVRQVDADLAGVEPFLLLASAYGTHNYPGESARRALARTGSSIHVSAQWDWTVYAFEGLKEEFDSTWAVFADRLLQPTLDSAGIEIVRQRMLGRVARRHASPEDYAWFLADSLVFHDHAYATHPDGSERSLRALGRDDLRRYAREQWVTSRMVLVVVGDVPRATVERAIARTIGTLPHGAYHWTLPDEPVAKKPALAASSRSATTNYIVGMLLGPLRSSREYPAFERAMHLLGGWISYFVREREGLSYAAGVNINDRGLPTGAIYLSTTKPDTAMKLVNFVLSAFESDVTIPRATLRSSAKAFGAAYLRQTETAAGHASLLAQALLYDGDPTAASRRPDVMGRLRFTDLRRSIRVYARSISYAFVGDTTQLPRREMTKR